MFFKDLSLKRVPSFIDRYEPEYSFPNCSKINYGERIIKVDPLGEKCIAGTFFIASDNTEYEVTAKYLKDNENTTQTVKNPLAISSNETLVHSLIKCLDKTKGCKLHVVRVSPSEFFYQEGNVTQYLDPNRTKQISYTYDHQYKTMSYFSTESSGSKKVYLKSHSKFSKSHYSYSYENVKIVNADNSVKKITNTTTNVNMSIIFHTANGRTRLNATYFDAQLYNDDEFPDIRDAREVGKEAGRESEGEITFKFEKIGDPPEGEEMLFEKEKLYLFNPENKIKTKKEVEKDTQKYDNPGLKGYQIALIVIAVVVVIVIIVVVVILLLKKGKESPKSNSGSGSGENA
ncbi:hypothetical protein TVAG_126780 [Trichomonas vaginalis G3]|uniref:Uncharacterized protein n=1 Tax=Trichomonas vaginalis (strain ATCC PRA-98 / G3) TaxID=412133 RepID=A2FHT7_TRIV3|nr:glycoprotein 38 family [Trichomonas vaginalis G3]XP_001308478.1 glycoprotein 38 family [Trichomonas vaginalis G3]EAX95547.1 hypothetical protein TVAG_126770 [Trichomonas vaginalis G3]EAX95548.1 hypothetical protein TVAG_126780 [Trichomonas vaginalis G3]KAI5514404.1 glycoprotein 38 family [Trichomonas vaginalis G3]KAI5514405.1 glycoprotein 38 family [Trichomonas vaginalis G3]|eukprot:XP_001308477.1 hypothetical protein [Trichomonas vaginalis G3]